MGSRPDKTYPINCDECKDINREFHNEDMNLFVKINADMIDQKFQTRQDLITDMRKIKQDVYVGKILLAVQTAAILILIIKVFG